jgi:copper chaperone CopZ
MMTRGENSKKISFSVTGMTCATCARIVERSLKKVDGVVFAGVNLATETAFVVLDKDVPMEELEEAVRKAGYDVSHEQPEDLDRRRYEGAKRNLVVSWGITAPLMVLMVFHMAGCEAEKKLEEVGITVNMNLIPFDPQKATVTSGIRIGLAGVTSRGFDEKDTEKVAKLLLRVLENNDKSSLSSFKEEVHAICAEHPIYMSKTELALRFQSKTKK